MALCLLICLPFVLLLSGCSQEQWNQPYSDEQVQSDTLFSSFSAPPKHLDPVISYSSNEWAILSQVYEPPLQYHYLKRPYSLEPLTLQQMPERVFLDEKGQSTKDASLAKFSEYTLSIKPDIRYQPHPAFVKNSDQTLFYSGLSSNQLSDIKQISDFRKMDSRTLTAADYVYAIKRMGVRQNHSPVLDTMSKYIIGLEDYSKKVTSDFKEFAKDKDADTDFFDLRPYAIEGVQVIDELTFKIRIKWVYPQFQYWLSMNFFAPIPWEADQFYKQAGLVEKNLTLDTSPVGTGAYQLVENNPNKRMRLTVNPNFHDEFYPVDGLAEGADKSLLNDAGKKLPFIKEVIYSLEKESVPLWNKFLQGYYDASGVSSDSFDQAVSVSTGGDMNLTSEMQEKGIKFLNVIQPSIMYFGFNMADSVVGGYSEKQQKLRQAISIAINYEEYISIFLNGRGIPAQGPIPPGIFGFQEGETGMNATVYDWKENRIERKSLEEAQRLLSEAGYPEGRLEDGTPLTLYFDTPATGPDSKAMLNWYRKQFSKLGIELVIRATDYNRFQDKVRGAKAQMFVWGWNADYPDPENFLFLLYGGNAAINTNGAGINSSNYDNPEFNTLFEQIKTMKSGDERQQLINKMVNLAQQDSPWIWGFNPKALALYHSWYFNVWANPLANNTVKYKRIDSEARFKQQSDWNQPVIWPLLIVFLIVVGSIYPLMQAYRSRQKAVIKSSKSSKEAR